MLKFTLLAAIVAVAAAGQGRSAPRLDGRIVGGSETTIEKAPHQISLQIYGGHMCSGSILDEKFVLTSALCTYGRGVSSLAVRAGSTKHASGGQLIKVKRIHQHLDFDLYNMDNDISILELQSRLVFSESVGPVDLPTKNQAIPAGSTATCTGWGDTGIGSVSKRLQTVDVNIVDWEECTDIYDDYDITERMICAGVPEGGKGACTGDSGGPLLVNGQQVGIASWGVGCSLEGYPGVYANIATLRDHITKVVGH